ncbi:unnamed protein product [Sphenostylis stenocarpa]|uniref:Uncharacterized protein n=1 Tax=Sphenostylis stenocarpa TaxID=92480 RepID=A0AA86S3U7_9FABA|nr:unnamed protein product [Sphenostylis stenocarpa]
MTWLKMGRKVISIEKGKGTERSVSVEKSGSGVSTDTNGKDRHKRNFSYSHQKWMQSNKALKIPSQVNTVRRWGLLGN